MRCDRARADFVAIEWVAAVTLLLLPAVVLVGSLPTWAERKHAATVAAREAARQLERDWPDGDPARAELVARYVAADHGVPAADVRVHVVAAGDVTGRAGPCRRRVRMPAIAVPGLARAGSWSYTATASFRIDDYRSR